jgi:hypothetical protein
LGAIGATNSAAITDSVIGISSEMPVRKPGVRFWLMSLPSFAAYGRARLGLATG